MRKGKSIIGKEVLSLAEGRRIHTVKDIIIGADNEDIIGLLVDEGGLLNSSLVIPIEQVTSFGRDAVVVSDAGAVLQASRYPRVSAIIDRKEKLIGKKVFTETGDEQGTISDIYFDESSGRILSFEVTGGVFNNVARGNSYLPVEDIVRVGPDVVYIHQAAVETMESQVGGVQGALAGAKERMGETAETARERAGEARAGVGERAAQAGDGARQRLGETTDTARGRAAEARPEESLIGRRAGKDVEDDAGDILVAANQRILPEHVERARAAGKLRDLTAAATMGQAQEVGAEASAAIGKAGDAAGSLWDQFTRKISEMTDSAGRRVDEEQTKKRLSDIEDAVGQPVTKVILDRQDNVILNLGDIITHEAVQRAYEAGGLDSLLSSVYKGEVSFEKHEMRVHPQAAATALTVERSTGEAPILDELEGKVQRAQQERELQKEMGKSQAEQERQQRERERQERAMQREVETAERRAEAEQGKQIAEQARSTSASTRSTGATSGGAPRVGGSDDVTVETTRR